MTRLTTLVLTSFAFLGIFACADSASARHRGDVFRQQRERELEAVRCSNRQAQEELRHWYQSQRNAIQADFDCARRRLSGRAWSEYVRSYSQQMANLTRYYADQRRALNLQKVETDKRIRDYYRQLERQSGVCHNTHWHGHGGHRHSAPCVARPNHHPHTRTSFSVQLPWIGFSIR